jgi:hypothetical protein
MLKLKTEPISFEKKAVFPVEVGVIVSLYNGQNSGQGIQNIERLRSTNISKMPDFIGWR